ncbi:MAG: ORF6N domain-containing protein [Planctomycetota bacterium]
MPDLWSAKSGSEPIKRNLDRFPPDFMFQLTKTEYEDLKSQIVIPSWGGARRGTPYAFTEQGVAMLSSVLKSGRAVRVNIEIMRAFVRLRRVLATHAELAWRLDELEARVGRHDEQFVAVIQAIRKLMEPPPEPKRRRIGFATEADR